MKYLALDIGTRRTGVAFLDDAVGIPLPLPTIHHESNQELLASVRSIVRERSIDRLVIGLPLLPSGTEGSQAVHVRGVAAELQELGLPLECIDERYTTHRRGHVRRAPPLPADTDAAAACSLLELFIRS